MNERELTLSLELLRQVVAQLEARVETLEQANETLTQRVDNGFADLCDRFGDD